MLGNEVNVLISHAAALAWSLSGRTSERRSKIMLAVCLLAGPNAPARSWTAGRIPRPPAFAGCKAVPNHERWRDVRETSGALRRL